MSMEASWCDDDDDSAMKNRKFAALVAVKAADDVSGISSIDDDDETESHSALRLEQLMADTRAQLRRERRGHIIGVSNRGEASRASSCDLPGVISVLERDVAAGDMDSLASVSQSIPFVLANLVNDSKFMSPDVVMSLEQRLQTMTDLLTRLLKKYESTDGSSERTPRRDSKKREPRLDPPTTSEEDHVVRGIDPPPFMQVIKEGGAEDAEDSEEEDRKPATRPDPPTSHSTEFELWNWSEGSSKKVPSPMPAKKPPLRQSPPTKSFRYGITPNWLSQAKSAAMPFDANVDDPAESDRKLPAKPTSLRKVDLPCGVTLLTPARVFSDAPWQGHEAEHIPANESVSDDLDRKPAAQPTISPNASITSLTRKEKLKTPREYAMQEWDKLQSLSRNRVDELSDRIEKKEGKSRKSSHPSLSASTPNDGVKVKADGSENLSEAVCGEAEDDLSSHSSLPESVSFPTDGSVEGNDYWNLRNRRRREGLDTPPGAFALRGIDHGSPRLQRPAVPLEESTPGAYNYVEGVREDNDDSAGGTVIIGDGTSTRALELTPRRDDADLNLPTAMPVSDYCAFPAYRADDPVLQRLDELENRLNGMPVATLETRRGVEVPCCIIS